MILSDQSPQINVQKIKTCLQSFSLSQKDYVKEEEMVDMINKLNNSPFDQHIFEQIWNQCKLNSKGEVKVAQFMQFILKAEDILAQNLKAVELKIAKMELEKHENEGYFEERKHKQKMENLYEEKQELKDNLKVIRRPFQQLFINAKALRSLPSLIVSNHKEDMSHKEYMNHKMKELPDQDDIDPQNQLFQYEASQTANYLSKIFYLTILLLATSISGSYMFNQFPNMVVCFVILMGFSTEAISRKIVKFNLTLLGISIIFNILWLLLYTNKMWAVGNHYEYPKFVQGYLQYSIFMVILGAFIKCVILCYYLTQLQVSQYDIFSVKLFGRSISMKMEPFPPHPSHHPLSHLLVPLFNKKKQEPTQNTRQTE